MVEGVIANRICYGTDIRTYAFLSIFLMVKNE